MVDLNPAISLQCTHNIQLFLVENVHKSVLKRNGKHSSISIFCEKYTRRNTTNVCNVSNVILFYSTFIKFFLVYQHWHIDQVDL